MRIVSTKGKVVRIDRESLPLLKGRRIYVGARGYAIVSIKTGEKKWSPTYVHRIIIGAIKGQEVDHINGDPLDNRVKNLRLCTKSENCRNKKMYKNNTLGVRGVVFHKPSGLYNARISVKPGKRIHIGYFKKIEDASKAYEEAAKKYYKEFIR